MSYLKPHYERVLRQNNNLAVSNKTELEVKRIIAELEDLGFQNLTYRQCDEVVSMTPFKKLEQNVKQASKSWNHNWIIEVRTDNKEVK